MTAATAPPPDNTVGTQCDLNQSVTLLLASLFAARRAGDHILTRIYQTRLVKLGVRIQFTTDDGNDAPTATVGA